MGRSAVKKVPRCLLAGRPSTPKGRTGRIETGGAGRGMGEEGGLCLVPSRPVFLAATTAREARGGWKEGGGDDACPVLGREEHTANIESAVKEGPDGGEGGRWREASECRRWRNVRSEAHHPLSRRDDRANGRTARRGQSAETRPHGAAQGQPKTGRTRGVGRKGRALLVFRDSRNGRGR